MSGSPTARRRRLGRLLRDLREVAGLTGEDAAAAVERSTSWVSRVESGQAGLRLRELRDLLQLYRLEDAALRAELEELAEAGRQRGWWNDYADSVPASFLRFVGLEAEAISILTYEDRVMPGMLQSPAYIRAVYELAIPPLSPAVIEGRTRLRRMRQDLLAGAQRPTFVAILDEAVLRRVIGGPTVHREQLEFLLAAVDSGTVDLQVVGFTSRDRAMVVHAFTVLTFEADPPVAFIDTMSGGYLDESDMVQQRYIPIWEHLRVVALDGSLSRQAIRTAIEETS